MPAEYLSRVRIESKFGKLTALLPTVTFRIRTAERRPEYEVTNLTATLTKPKQRRRRPRTPFYDRRARSRCRGSSPEELLAEIHS